MYLKNILTSSNGMKRLLLIKYIFTSKDILALNVSKYIKYFFTNYINKLYTNYIKYFIVILIFSGK